MGLSSVELGSYSHSCLFHIVDIERLIKGHAHVFLHFQKKQHKQTNKKTQQ